MFKFAKSILDAVFGKKRPLETDEDDQEQQASENKRQKMTMVYRVKVNNLPRAEMEGIRTFFKKMGYVRVSKAPRWTYAFISVDTEQEAQECVKTINECVYKNTPLSAEILIQTEDEFRNRSNTRTKRRKGSNKDEIENDARTPAEKLSDQVTPMWRKSYDIQLKDKNNKGIRQLVTLKKRVTELTKTARDPSQIEWALQKGRLPCEVLDPVPSPQTNGYRTKCEFTIGKDLDGEPTVGFLLGLYREGVTSVLDPSECLHIPDIAKKIAKAMCDYIRQSGLPVYDRVTKEGYWRTLMTKTQSTGDILVLVQMRDEDLSSERVEEIKKDLIRFWNEESGVKVTTLLFQSWNGASNGFTDKAPIDILTGDGYIYENLLDCRFRLSASAFFQVNTPATELLYSKCAEWCNIDKEKKTTLLDLCCGTGTIGITMAKSVDRVIGIEMVPEAIVDAKENAKLNDIKNVTYYADKVENKIDIVQNEENEEVIAVLDPPRNGVHASVIRAIRKAKHIDRVIYISCDAKQAFNNFLGLCRPESNSFVGMPFKPARAISFDLFPHTDHCELMIEFVRIKDNLQE
ncbi:S-adenosyl-L-methionine-dependent methyltransferase [Cokeromyces recurvatus]|uniref:S-adenosyl-L-methionine-dependent methyltransferase n=1 Tax=Cokeromyces recurvatus TaxID=90255 RepID=UPI00221FEC10|nr:S-adenosyl-L-methionine-dependent methyltransferase [Cokeromyces recurvatus]KAI7899941.1 S-adenosyl-L-methionine-dependent methyltransferase [Cokeromyces recurvatus]